MGKAKRHKKVKKHFSRPYIKYRLETPLVKSVKKKYMKLKADPTVINCKILTMLSNEFKIPRPTLISWKKKWEVTEPDWMPGDGHNYSKAKRIFTDSMEAGISDYLIENYITKEKYFPDRMLKNVMFN